MNIPPPDGICEDDYEAVEAAVLETVRGRWFLAEFARRNRVHEMRHVLDAIGRLEHAVADQRAQPADPSIRLLVQRLKEVSQQLDALAIDMRGRGHEEALCAKVEAQARAVAGLLRAQDGPPPLAAKVPERVAPPQRALPKETAPAAPPPANLPPPPSPAASDKASRRTALERLDALTVAEKLALFG